MAIATLGTLLITAAFCGLVSIFVFRYRRRHLYMASDKFPGPPTYPIIGNAHWFIGDTADILNKMMKLMNEYPSPCRAWLASRLFFAVHDPEQLKAIFLSAKTIEKEDLYKFVRPWLGTGLFTAPVTKWRIHRKLISPTFNSRILDSFVDVFAKQSEIMTEQMEKELQGGEFDIFHYVSLCTLDIICETAMGVSINAQTDRIGRYVNAVKRMSEIVLTRMFKIWLHPDFIFNLTKYGRDQRECLAYLHGITNDVIRKAKEAYKNDMRMQNEASSQGPRKIKAFLHLLMELSNDGTKFTDEELREEVDTMILAGNDTTALINSSVMLMLANYPQVQERVYQELHDIYGDEVSSSKPILTEHLNRMEYLERVIKETMRLFPVAAFIVRQVTEDIDLGDCTLPKGSSAIIAVLKVHRSEKYWTDPLKFDPDRFLPEEVAKRHPYCYMPFSAGARNCIGLKYAMMAMKVLLATVLRRYILKKDKILQIQDIELKADLMLKLKDPVTIRIAERNPNTHTDKQ